ncbi:DUF6221 family protein [Catelliglobosispora koreensis]|uniref:DUF6221 family protein n=1 Tax=Catelliglobosispora koreensis TaxID=129052 RepID=UPI000360C17E|nr:DUF6221 family protein [Catelliglobosispora koreensis]
MTDLIDRLNAALDEDERIAERINFSGHWVIDLNGEWPIGAEQRMLDHVMRHDPTRVLRQVEGARKILARHQPDAEWCGSCAEQDDYDNLFIVWPCPTILALAEMFGVEP